MPPPEIHPRAVVDPGAELASGVQVGAYAIIDRGAHIGAGCHIGEHAIVRGGTRLGEQSRVFPFCSLGEAPQHQGYLGEPSELVIGAHTTIREYCTLNRGTGGGATRIGEHNFLMAYAHIAHDCVLGEHIVFANGASLAGHSTVGDYAILGGFTLVHQRCAIGAHSITGIGSVCLQDVPPFITAAGNTAAPFGVNTTGLRRRDFSEATIGALKRAYRLLYRSGLDLQRAIREIEGLRGAAAGESTGSAATTATTDSAAETNAALTTLCDFLRESARGIIR